MAALITGAGGTLGRAIAQRLATDGHAVAAADNDLDAARGTTESIGSAATVMALHGDVADPADIQRMVAAVEAHIGPVDVLVNNAAVFPSGPFVEVTPEEFDRTVAVNQRGYFLCAQRVARSLIEGRRSGAIVNIASIVWHGYWTQMSPYVSTKGGVVALTRALARELGPHDIRVNAVAPGAFPTAAERAQHADLAAYERRILDAQALKRRGTAEELAAAVAFLAGPQSSFVTGQTLNVDGGWVMS